MAFWGIELAESDEFCTPYDDFVDLFEIGEEPANITAILLEQYRNQYGSDEKIHSIQRHLRPCESPVDVLRSVARNP